MDVDAARKFAAAIVLGIGTIGPALGIGWAVSHAMDATARNPEAAGDIRTSMTLGIGLIEAIAIYAFVVAIILNFA